MNYVKKMCILRQAKQGFSGDGKALSGLIKLEQYGKNLAVEVSIINFAPLTLGEYYCILSDEVGRTETLALRGKSLFNILTDMDVSNGFCGVICYVKNEIVPVAYGINGGGTYDWKRILASTLPPSYLENNEETATAKSPQPPKKNDYEDEAVAEKNYFAEEVKSEQERAYQTESNAPNQGGVKEQTEEARADAAKDGYDEDLRHPFKTDGDGYYQAVKSEVDELLSSHPKDERLKNAFPHSEWVRIRGTEEKPECLVGVVYDGGKARYICYALPASDSTPPEEIKDSCSFVPLSVFDDKEGFFVIFQSASTGECVKPRFA